MCCVACEENSARAAGASWRLVGKGRWRRRESRVTAVTLCAGVGCPATVTTRLADTGLVLQPVTTSYLVTSFLMKP
jgi:hypothetical protein